MNKTTKQRVHRISAFVMALALIMTTIIPYSYLTGIFAITVQAAQKKEATWSYANSTLYDSSGTEKTDITSGTLKNENGDVLTILSGEFKKRTTANSDYQINAETEVKVPIVSGAKVVMIKVDAYYPISSDSNGNIEVTAYRKSTDDTDSYVKVDNGVTYDVTSSTTNGYKNKSIDCTLDGTVDYIVLKFKTQNYFKTFSVISSTSATTITSAAFHDDDTYEATWDYTKLSCSIDNTSGNVESENKDILYVDATGGGKFVASASYIQVNQGTKVTLPTKGNKVTITMTVYKDNADVVSDFLESKWSLSGRGDALVKKEVKSITANGDYKDVVIECYMDGEDGEITLESLTNTYIRTITEKCEVLPTVTIKGTITSSSALSNDMKVIATNATTNIKYSSNVEIAENGMTGTYSVDVLAEDTDMKYELAMSSDEYAIYEGNTTQTVSKESASSITADLKVKKLDTVTITGSITGLESVDLTDFGLIFEDQDETADYTPDIEVDTTDTASIKYSAKVKKGDVYKVKLEGVNDYEVTSPASTVTYDSADTLDITAAKKALYHVTLTLADSPDLSEKNITYTYTNTSDGYVYTFENSDNIELRDGTYTLTLGGDFAQFPYSANLGAEVTVAGKTVDQTVILEEVTSWNFYKTTGDYYKDTIQNKIGYYNGLTINATCTNGKLAPNGAADSANSAQFTNGTTITVPVSGKCTVSVVSYGTTAEYALYEISGTDSSTTVSASGSDSSISTYKYTSADAGTVVITSTGGAYIKSISVAYAAKEVEYKEQEAMPSKSGNTADSSFIVQPEGQRIKITQNGGKLTTTDNAIDSSVSYYGFDATTSWTKLTADVTITDCGSDNSNGVFFGAFDGTYVATIGLRKGTGLKCVYSKSAKDFVGTGGDVTGDVSIGQTVTFTAEKTSDGLVISVTPKGGATQTQTFKYNSDSYYLFSKDGANQKVSYGFIFAGVEAVITNMKYYYYNSEAEVADKYVLKYDQNDCYKAKGTAPVVSSVNAEAASTRDYITVSWTASTPASGDGKYQLEVSTDGGSHWKVVAADIEGTSYDYSISESGSYLFRVCGKLGVNGEPITEKAVTTSSAVDVILALKSPVVSISSTASSVDLSWAAIDNAVRYEVYRYSYDDTAANAKLAATVTSPSYSYKDTDVTAEMPYYYYVIAYSTDNSSNPSETVWAVPSAGHTGKYVYESDAAGITITKKSYDTVYDSKITLEGVVEKAGTVNLIVNGTTVATQKVNVRGTFAFDDVEIVEGRNDVNIEVTDTDENITRQTFNFVYLTNYDKVVDSAFTGTDGEEVNGIPTYSTVQAAVNSVSASNAERVVILVKAGDYEEHLTVSTPNITLIGEDSTKTRIFYDTKDYVGGDTDKRCAVYIKSGAKGFSAENLTFENTYEYLGDGSRSNESCDALRNDANEASYINVRILGYQDTLNANGGTQYYYKCYIAGNVDFIYGNDPRALFNDCQLVFRYNSNKNSGYVCAPRTNANASYGLTFYNCQVLSEDGCSGGKYYLARPWGADAYITWIDCYMGKIIKANASNPYSKMDNNEPTAARFFEYGSYGPGYAINVYRRQISSNKAKEMISSSYLGWNPDEAVTSIGNAYKGTIKTDSENTTINTEYVTDSYAETEGNDTGFSKYSIEGYAQAAKVTGGGTLMEDSENYYKVGTAGEFLDALVNIKKTGKASVVELTGDIALGSKEVTNFESYSSIITAHQYQALTHPTLMKTGVSMLQLEGMSNITIYSKNGAKITHVCTDLRDSSNIIIRNITFDELWEWDEETSGGYDRNDWDYLTIEKGSCDIWVDHCTFYKAYDGVIDIKTPTSSSNITISWCSFQPASAGQTSPEDGGTFFNTMMKAMEDNPSAYKYYSHLLEEGMTAVQIRGYAYGQKKTHLLGQADDDSTAKNITVTFANNYYKDSMDRMPRLRFGTAHVYNCILDAQDLREIKAGITNSTLASKIVSNGASSNMGARVLLENCYISGITNALISGNGDSERGYINAINSAYYLDGKATELKVINNSSNKDLAPLVQDADEFTSALPYSGYTLYNADELYTEVQPYTGAGVLKLTTLQWERTIYHEWTEDSRKDATCVEDGEVVYKCDCGLEKVEVIPATGEHDFSEDWTTDKAPTCIETGSKSHHCTVCGEKKDVTDVDMIDHKWNEGEITVPVTCTEDGEMTFKCTVCEEEMTEILYATGHTWSEEWTIDKQATTEEAGEKSHHCIYGDAREDVTEIPKLKNPSESETEPSTGDTTTDPSTEETTKPSTEDTTKPSTEETTKPSTEDTTKPSMEETTKPEVTEPTTTPSVTPTEPTTPSVTPTEPTTAPSVTPTEPTTTPSVTPSEPTTPSVTPTEPTTPSVTPTEPTTPSVTPTEPTTPEVTEPTTTPSVTPTEPTTPDVTEPTVSETPTEEEIVVDESEAGSAQITVSNVTEDVPQTTFTESKSEVLNKLLTAEEKVAVKAGAEVKVSMNIETVKAEDKPVESAAITAAVEAMSEQNTIGIYLDITLEKNVGDNAPVKVTETVTGKLSISVEVPEEMLNKDNTKTRKYNVVRYHEGADGKVLVDILDCSFADGKITFESDKFSVYAIVYSDSEVTTAASDKNDNNTQATASQQAGSSTEGGNDVSTGDALSLASVLGLFVLMMTSAVVLALLFRKKEA